MRRMPDATRRPPRPPSTLSPRAIRGTRTKPMITPNFQLPTSKDGELVRLGVGNWSWEFLRTPRTPVGRARSAGDRGLPHGWRASGRPSRRCSSSRGRYCLLNSSAMRAVAASRPSNPRTISVRPPVSSVIWCSASALTRSPFVIARLKMPPVLCGNTGRLAARETGTETGSESAQVAATRARWSCCVRCRRRRARRRAPRSRESAAAIPRR